MRTPKAAQAIRKAYLELLAQEPSEKITVTQIVQRAGVSRMTFYRLYQTREEVLTDILDGFSEKNNALIEELPNLAPENTYPVLDVLEHHKRHMPVLRTVLSSDMASLFERRVEDGVRRSIENRYPPEEDGSTPLFVSFYAAGVGRVICDWIRSGCAKDPSEILEFFDALSSRLAS